MLALDAAGPCRSRRCGSSWVDPPPPPRERLLPAGRRLGRTWARRFPATVEPGTLAYDATHRALVGSLLDDEEWGALFAGGAQLPAGLGAGFDERVVEYPWLFSRGLSGRVLDAGSVLNHRHLVERLLPAVEDLTIVTLAPEPTAHTSLGVSYLYGDLRRAAVPRRLVRRGRLPLHPRARRDGQQRSTARPLPAPRTRGPRRRRRCASCCASCVPAAASTSACPSAAAKTTAGTGSSTARTSTTCSRRPAPAVTRRPCSATRDAAGAAARRGEPPRARYNPGPERARDGAVAARAVLCATIHRAA